MILETFIINLGYKCNFSCDHCLDRSDLFQTDGDLELSDINSIINTINNSKPMEIYFVGGETILYLEKIIKILNGFNYYDELKIRIRTNGFFATNIENTFKILDQIKLLKQIELSVDFFHLKKKIDYDLIISNLKTYASSKDIKFILKSTVSTEFEAIRIISMFSKFDLKIDITKVIDVGRAKETGVGFKFKEFDKKVFNSICPMRGNIVYFAKRGYTFCCSALTIRGENDFNFIYEENVNKLSDNLFYKAINELSIGELANKFDISINQNDLKPKHSSTCSMCRYLFKKCSKVL